jgi:hypothetical protein
MTSQRMAIKIVFVCGSMARTPFPLHAAKILNGKCMLIKAVVKNK